MNNNLKSLSSGLRINSAADGPADLVISEHMRSQISGINQAVKNSETSNLYNEFILKNKIVLQPKQINNNIIK